MPQRQFWTSQHPCRVSFVLHENPQKPAADPTLSMTVYDQEGAMMVRQATSLPTGFVPWAMADTVKQAMEAYSVSTPEDAVKAFKGAAAEWREDVRQLGLLE